MCHCDAPEQVMFDVVAVENRRTRSERPVERHLRELVLDKRDPAGHEETVHHGLEAWFERRGLDERPSTTHRPKLRDALGNAGWLSKCPANRYGRYVADVPQVV